MPVRAVRGALPRPLGGGLADVGVDFLLAGGVRFAEGETRRSRMTIGIAAASKSQWHAWVPESVKVWPAIGMNCQS